MKNMSKMVICRKLAVYTAFCFSALALVCGHVFASENNREDIVCPSENFSEFFKVFLNDENVQRAFTKTPLMILNADRNAKPNWIRALKMLDKEQIRLPLFPSSQERKERSLDVQIIGVTDSRAEVVMTRSHLVRDSFLFEKGACWKLTFVKYDLSHPPMQDIRDEKTSSENSNSCPFPDFPDFLEAFMGDETIQRAFTKKPLMNRYVTDTNADFIRTIGLLDQHKIKFPLFPSLKTIMNRSLTFSVVGTSERNAEVELKGSNSGVLMNYLFSKDFGEEPCWKLVFIDDQSM